MSDMTSLEIDSKSRERIVSEIGSNFFVEAGAGSGKTTMLVNRMVAMVEAGIPINEICAITFTRAAANEFYDRFQKILIKRSNPSYVWENKGYAGELPKPTDKTRELCEKALQNIDLCFMGTIDSFCSMVLSEHPFEAEIPSDADLISDEEEKIIYKQEYLKIQKGEYDHLCPNLSELAAVFRSFYYDSEVAFALGMALFMDNRNVHFNFKEMTVDDIDKTFASEKADILKAVKCLITHRSVISSTNDKTRKAGEELNNINSAIRRRWSSNFSNVLYYLGILSGIRVLPDGIEVFGDSLGELFEEGKAKDGSYGMVIGGENGTLTKLKNIRYSVSMTFFSKCVPVLEEVMRDRGKMSYFDYLYYLREMLKRDAFNDGNLIKYISKHHRYFLIDEFQDTNPMQAEVFFYLASDEPDPAWMKCKPRKGSLFIVGDPKQSIYRFRSADVASYMKVKKIFESNGDDVLSLPRNFRSTKTLCSYFNDVFSKLLPEETPDQSKFADIPLPDERPDEFQGVYRYEALTGGMSEIYPEQTDPPMIARIVDTLVDNDEYVIRGENDKKPRKIKYSDIMVITYGKGKLAPILSEFDSKGIPARVEGTVPFGANKALKEIYWIISAIADVNDKIALYGALTGNLIGLTKEQIICYKDQGGRVSLSSSFDIEDCKDETAKLVASKIDELKKLHYKAISLSPAALFAKVMDDYKVYERVPANNIEVVYYTLELIRNAEKEGLVISLKDCVGYMSILMNGESDEERCLSLSDDRDAVHMANLHKVKGLEAPIVILAAAIRFANSNPLRVVHGEKGSEGYLFKLDKEKNKEGKPTGLYFDTTEFADESGDEKAAAKAENDRLLYVAATRARNALILCDSTYGTDKVIRGSIWKPLMSDDQPDFFEGLDSRYEVKAPKRESVDSIVLYKEAADECVLNDRSNEAATYSLENPSRVHISSKIIDEGVASDSDIELDEDDVKTKDSTKSDVSKDVHKYPALLGTMTHKLMEMLALTKNKVDASQAVDEIIREYRTKAMEAYEDKLRTALTDVAAKMRSGGYEQENALPKDMLSVLLDSDEVYCEVPFCYADEVEGGKVLWNGIMDVVYLSKGKWHIVDYKTNADGSDLDKKYQGQLQAYIKAFKATTGNDADAYTYHIDI